MSDVVTRLNEAMFDIKDKTRISADLWNPLALSICDAQDEIERLREALRAIRDYDGHNPVIYDADDAIAMKEIARTALGEKE